MTTSSKTGTRTETQIESWLAKLTKEVADLVETGQFIEPPPDLISEEDKATVSDGSGDEPDPKILGDMTPTMKALYTLWQEEAHRELRIMVDAMDPRRRMTTSDVRRRINASTARAATLRSLLWAEVENQFPAPENTDLGIRKGFKVVQLPPKTGGHLFLHRLFEGVDGLKGLLDP